jgi:hypothetical protein
MDFFKKTQQHLQKAWVCVPTHKFLAPVPDMLLPQAKTMGSNSMHRAMW